MTSDEKVREEIDTGLTDAYERRFDRQVERDLFGVAPAPASPKVTSPELAALAATYINLTYPAAEGLKPAQAKALVDDIRRLAASVLSQAEAK